MESDARDRLFAAIEEEDELVGLSRTKAVIQEGVDVASLGLDEAGYSVLYWATFKDRLKIARCLIEAGATLDCEATDSRDGQLPPEVSSLHNAVEHGNREMVEVLLSAGGKPLLHRFDAVERTPLHVAAERGDLAMVKLLISAGADVNATEEAHNGYSPLDLAVESRSLEVVRWLLGAGADPMKRTWMQICPVERAADMGAAGGAMLEEFRRRVRMSGASWEQLTRRRGERSGP